MNIARRTIITLTCLTVLLHISYADAGVFNWIKKILIEVAPSIDGVTAETASEANAANSSGCAMLRKLLQNFDAELLHTMSDHTLPKGRAILLKVFGGTLKFIFAKAHAEKFGKKFLMGARYSEAHLDSLRKLKPQLVDPWRSVLQENRVFVVGASESTSDARMIKANLEKVGYKTFFYRFCGSILCDEEEVGAFFSSAGHVINIKSAASDASSFIHVEHAAINGFNTGRYLIILTPDDFINGLIRRPTARLKVQIIKLPLRFSVDSVDDDVESGEPADTATVTKGQGKTAAGNDSGHKMQNSQKSIVLTIPRKEEETR